MTIKLYLAVGNANEGDFNILKQEKSATRVTLDKPYMIGLIKWHQPDLCIDYF